MINQFEIRLLSRDDRQGLAACVKLSVQCFADKPAQQWNQDQLQSHIDVNENVICVAQAGESVLAFAVIALLDGEAELLSICSDPACRREGVARKLMEYVLKGLQPKQVLLEVSAENLAAIGLYEGLGFSQIARRRNYYRGQHGSRVDALIMRLKRLS